MTKRSTGIYEVSGWLTPFAYQVVDLAIVGKGWEILKILVPGASEKDIKTVCDEYAKTPDGPEREHYETVLRISMMNNAETYERMDREGISLNNAAEKIFKDQFEKARKDAAQSAVQQNREETAKAMIIEDLPIELIAKVTKLPLDSILGIAKKLSPAAAAS